MAFQIPLHFEDLTRSSAAEWRVRSSPLSLPDQLESIQQSMLEILTSSTGPSTNFAYLHNVITRYSSLSKPQRTLLVSIADDLVSSASAEPSQMKISLFFLSGLTATAASVSPVCKFWEKTGRESVLEAISRLLTKISSSASFPPSDLDQISGLLVRTVLQVLEKTSAARDKNTRAVLARIFATTLAIHTRQSLPAITALLHALSRHEHLPIPIAEILVKMTEENGELVKFVSDFVCEIARHPYEQFVRDVTAAKAFSLLMSELAERMPQVFRSNLALVLSQLDGESYTMRNGVVHIIGVLIKAQPRPDDPLLDVLLERSQRDINAFTRSKALQTWIALVANKAVPNQLFSVLANMAASRLDDKAAAVRKYAAQLMVNLMEHNPFGPALRLSHFKGKLLEICEAENSDVDDAQHLDSEEVDPNVAVDGAEGSDTDVEPLSREAEEAIQDTDDEDQSIVEADVSNENADIEMNQDDADLSQKQESAEEIRKKYYTFAVAFIQSVESGLETIYKLLRSKSVTDVSEAVSFLIAAIQFQLEAASGKAVRKMLPLVLSRERNIRQAVVNAYIKLLAPGGLDRVEEKDVALGIASGLTALAHEATTGEIACLEELISAIFNSTDTTKLISPSVVSVLWDLFAGNVPGASEGQRRSACILVGMVAAERPDSLQQRVAILEREGLTNSSFARWSCAALCKLPQESDADGRLSRQLFELIISTSQLSTVEQALSAIFVLSPEPEPLVGELIRKLSQGLHENPQAVPVSALAKFLQVIGHVAVKELVRIEALVSRLRRNVANQSQDDADHEQEEQAFAEADKALQMAEKELVSPNSLLGKYGNLARKIASDLSAPAELQASAVLCLSKLMCVEEKFCGQNLRLLFSILSSSSEPLVRSNAITSMGDLAFRFPNLVEPWNPRIYAVLQDNDELVRKNALMALTHLILNDMVKVKGQMVGLAICILDENQRISDVARLFFLELARKSSNAIYNILPDLISCMSQMESLKSEDFKTVVAFLVGLMDKEKHADGMVEKLCHRFRTNESDRENHDLAYCISQLNISERGVKKMNDQFKSYSAALSDDVVHGLLMQAINKCNKNNSSGQVSQVVEELTSRIDGFRRAAIEAAAEEDQVRRGSTARRSSEANGNSQISAATRVRRSTQRRQNQNDRSSSASENSSGIQSSEHIALKGNFSSATPDTLVEEIETTERSTRKVGRRRARRSQNNTESDEDVDDDLRESDRLKQGPRQRPSRGRHCVQDDSSGQSSQSESEGYESEETNSDDKASEVDSNMETRRPRRSTRGSLSRSCKANRKESGSTPMSTDDENNPSAANRTRGRKRLVDESEDEESE